MILAYLDPGTGSYFFQLLIASALGALFFIKQWGRKVTGFFRRRFRGKPPPGAR